MNIHEALLNVRRNVGVITPETQHEFHNFKYRGINEILNAVGPALLDQGVNVVPTITRLDSRDVQTARGARHREVTVWVRYTYRADDGSSVDAEVPGESSDAASSAVSKAMSVALRIAHIQVLQIPTHEADPENTGLKRGADPIIELRRKIWTAAIEKGGLIAKADDGTDDYSELEADFVAWTQGTPLNSATEGQYRDYLAHLTPAVKMQRKGATKSVQQRSGGGAAGGRGKPTAR